MYKLTSESEDITGYVFNQKRIADARKSQDKRNQITIAPMQN